jgi:DNA polymerase-3 subunit delta
VAPAFKPAYLIHGDDHGRLAERRAKLRALAEQGSGPGGVEVFEGEACTAEAVALALSAMTFAMGRRFVIAEGVERWRDSELKVLAPVMAALPEETTVVFFAREEGRAKAPEGLRKLVEKAGGAIDEESAVKPWDLPKWAVAQARDMGLELDSAAAKALVHRVGERQQRLLRELEKLALELGPGAKVDTEAIEELTAGSAERKIWSLADALVARDRARAMDRYLELRAAGERLPGLLYWMTTRVRLAHEVVARLEAGESEAQVRRSLRMPPKAASAFLADAQRSDVRRLRRALERLADLEVETRGGGTLAEDTAALRAIAAIAA